MKTTLKNVTAAIGVGVLGVGFSTHVNAGCTYLDQKATPSLWEQPLGYSEGRLMRTGFEQASDDNNSIVGLWKFSFTAKGNAPPGPPDGVPIDQGYVAWHSDGTEIMNSSRAPTTGDFCMGMWKQTGASTYRLNHFALAWAFDAAAPETGPGTGGADFIGPAQLRETVTVARDGMSYSGTFHLVQYLADKQTVVADVVGIVNGKRITLNSGVAD